MRAVAAVALALITGWQYSLDHNSVIAWLAALIVLVLLFVSVATDESSKGSQRFRVAVVADWLLLIDVLIAAIIGFPDRSEASHTVRSFLPLWCVLGMLNRNRDRFQPLWAVIAPRLGMPRPKRRADPQLRNGDRLEA